MQRILIEQSKLGAIEAVGDFSGLSEQPQLLHTGQCRAKLLQAVLRVLAAVADQIEPHEGEQFVEKQ